MKAFHLLSLIYVSMFSLLVLENREKNRLGDEAATGNTTLTQGGKNKIVSSFSPLFSYLYLYRFM